MYTHTNRSRGNTRGNTRTRPNDRFGRSTQRFSRGGAQHGASRRGGRFSSPKIDISRYINKAQDPAKVEAFVPEHHFTDFSLDERLQENISAKGYVEPTPIQDSAITHVLAGEDVVGIANTGTGKTAAFLLPLLTRALANRNESFLIMSPTRELAQQTYDEFRTFAGRLPVHAAVCVGGTSIGGQISMLRRRPQFVIGTPGRLKDLLERRVLVLSNVKSVVLDEADRMLDMGFIGDMRQILALIPEKHQTLFFSATISREIERLVGEFLNDPVRVSVKTQDVAISIEQDIVRVPRGSDKISILEDFLKKPEFDKVLVFGRTKFGVDKLAHTLSQHGFKAESIHGNKTQGRRQKALNLFKRGHVKVLVATDVAARGLDINGVSHVINFDMPMTQEDYIHRIGRTGRAGKKGIALTFVS
ncbi:ATP-dependent RNA helicase RhlE [hydrothermal vent metagenome]|uniref:ATP-dependent RNA helicase RhlE n=1 Tax=hydrothermal vent metagenome TaxID=652676 RepID=A0A3B0V1R1_9ZZZZ